MASSSSWWTVKLYAYFFVIGFLIDFTSIPEFLFWQSKGYNVNENRVIEVIVHLPTVFKALFSWKINSMSSKQVNRLLWVISGLNCVFNLTFSMFNNFAAVLTSLFLSQMLMVMLFTCLEYHMVKDLNTVSKSNVFRLIGKAFGKLFSMTQRGVDMSNLFVAASVIQGVFTFVLFLLPIHDSPPKPGEFIVQVTPEEPVEKPTFRESISSCCRTLCVCFTEEKKAISTLSWFVFLISAIPVYMQIVMYNLTDEKRFPENWFGYFGFFEGIGAVVVVIYFIRCITEEMLTVDRTRAYCLIYICLKVIIGVFIVYGLVQTSLDDDEVITLWNCIFIMISFADEGLHNLFLLDTTKQAEGSVFYLAKCQFIQILGMIASFTITTISLCTFGLDRKNYSSLVSFVNVTTLLTIGTLPAIYYL